MVASAIRATRTMLPAGAAGVAPAGTAVLAPQPGRPPSPPPSHSLALQPPAQAGGASLMAASLQSAHSWPAAAITADSPAFCLFHFHVPRLSRVQFFTAAAGGPPPASSHTSTKTCPRRRRRRRACSHALWWPGRGVACQCRPHWHARGAAPSWGAQERWNAWAA